MTEEQALKTCSGAVAYHDRKGYFPFDAANFLVATGKYRFEASGPRGYVLSLIPAQERAQLAAMKAKGEHGGALDWLNK